MNAEDQPPWRLSAEEVAAIVEGRHGDPYSVLGPHRAPGGVVVRAFVPNADHLEAREPGGGVLASLGRRSSEGFFEGLIAGASWPLAYRLRASNAGGDWELDDLYRYGPILGPMDDYLLVEGTHRRLYERLGAHVVRVEGVSGVHFAVWAPRALRVSVVGDFNDWDGRRCQMRRRVDSGLWEAFVPGLGTGAIYKYEIVGCEGNLLPLKADPFGFGSELRPSTASVVTAVDHFQWTDGAYLEARAAEDPRRRPMSIYEVHLGSWRRGADGGFQSYDEIADALIPYVAGLGFTHIELMPVNEHPLDASWGYQPIGLFAPTRRFGAPDGFARLIDRAHGAGLGVIMDWVPAHFPFDRHGLAEFDGAPLYEHADPRRGFHPDWNTAIFDFGRREVVNVLLANALYWLEIFHVDGLRVDAVASMLHLDYSREPGQWLPNAEGGRENREAEAFLKRLNVLVYGSAPGAVTIAEESTTWTGVTAPVDAGGLGFGFKWNMGWMNDTLDYMSKDPVYRRHHHRSLTFGLLYAFSENFVLPLSHDEVVHGKGTILSRMPGDDWTAFAGVRAYYGFMWGYPGKKLLFMGQEFAQRREWNFASQLDWELLDAPAHDGVSRAVRDLNHIYAQEPALYARDCEAEGFSWIVVDDELQSVFAWMRFGAPGDPPVAVVSNFTPVPRKDYRIGLPFAGRWREIFNSDAQEYGGSGLGNWGWVQATPFGAHGLNASAEIFIPPLATLYFRFQTEELARSGVRLKELAMVAAKPGLAPLSRHTMAFVLAGGRGSRLCELTDIRAKPAVYFGGKFRIVDFALSNALNSGIRRIAVATQYKAHSLIRHLQRGWNFFRLERNETFDILPASQRVSEEKWYLGTADAVFQNMDIIQDYDCQYVIILAGDHVYKMDYEPMLQQHVDQGADVTIGCLEAPRSEASGFGVMHVDSDDRILDFVEKPADPPAIPGRPDMSLVSMGIYVFNIAFLAEELRRDASDPQSSHDFGKDIIPRLVRGAKAVAHPFGRSAIRPTPAAEPYWRDVGTVDSYFDANIDLTEIVPDLDLYDRSWPIWTYSEMNAPAKFVHDAPGRRGSAVASLVAGDCIVSGASVRRSLLFSGVRVNSFARLERGVVLPGVEIGRSCQLRNVIIDRGVKIPNNLVVGYDPIEDALRFRRSERGVCLVTQRMIDRLGV